MCLYVCVSQYTYECQSTLLHRFWESTQVIRLGRKCLYALSHLTIPYFYVVFVIYWDQFILSAGMQYKCVQQPSYVQKVVFHSIPPHPLALTFFPSPLPLCSLSLGVLIQLSHVWLISEQSFILSILMIIMNHYISCCPTVERSFWPRQSAWLMSWI